MIYNIHGFQHARLLEVGLDNDDALILRAIKNMYSSATIEYKIIDNKRYVWIKQDYLQKQVTLVGSKKKIMRRVERMVEKGVLETKTLYSRKGRRGTYFYVNMTPLSDRLTDIGPNDKMSKGNEDHRTKRDTGGRTKRPKDGRTKWDTKDTQEIIDTQEIRYTTSASHDAQEEEKPKKQFNKDYIIDTWNSLDSRISKVVSINYGTKRYNSLKARVEEYGEIEVIKAIQSIDDSEFLKGNNDRGWKITFDWFVKPNNFIKVLEGNYIEEDTTNHEQASLRADEEMKRKIERAMKILE